MSKTGNGQPLLQRLPSVVEDEEWSEQLHFEVAENSSRRLRGLTDQKVFLKNLGLAFSMGFWIMLFYIPVCSKKAHSWLFVAGNPGYEYFTKHVQLEANDMEGYWPNVVQLMFFTVYFSTGLTVQLGWQGLAGTMAASLNINVMASIFPHGGKCTVAPGESVCSFVDPNYEACYWFIWFDFFVFVFLVLASNAETNTMKFSLSWHMFNMMSFMSPAGYVHSRTVEITSLIGAVLAIIVTLIPVDQLLSRHIKTDPEKISSTIEHFTTGAISLHLEGAQLNRYMRVSAMYSLEHVCNSIQGTVDGSKADFQASWWEGGGFCGQAKLRKNIYMLIKAFDDDIGGFDDIFYSLQKAVLSEDTETYKELTEAEHNDIAKGRQRFGPYLQQVNDDAMALLKGLTVDFIQHGQFPGAAGVESVNRSSAQLREVFFQYEAEIGVEKLSRARKKIRVNTNMIIYSILALADRIIILYAAVEKERASKAHGIKRILWGILLSGVSTFYLKLGDREKRMFAVRNTLSIGICFIIPFHATGFLMEGRSALMASTLAVLISTFPGSAFYKNLMRLLGITLGKVLPIIVMAIVHLVASSHGTLVSEVVHLIAVFIYMAFFSYMYYTSPEWSYVGCLIAGFGCYGLVGLHVEEAQAADYVTRYRELGQVTVAIMIQLTVDCIDTSWSKQWPRDVIVRNMRQIGMNTDANDKEDGLIIQAYKHFFTGDFDGMKKRITEAKGILAGQAVMLSECASKTLVVRGMKTPFPHDLCSKALYYIDKILDEAEILYLIENSNVIQEEPVEWQMVYMHYKDRVVPTLRLAFRALQHVLELETEDAKINPKVRDPRDKEKAVEESNRIRVTVANRALHDCLEHCFDLEHICYSSGRFGSY